MRTAIVSALLAAVPLWCWAGGQAMQQTESQQQSPEAAPKSLSPVLPVPQKTGPSETASDPAKMAAPAAAPGARPSGGAPVDAKAYVIGAQDVLRVLVWGNAPLSADYLVRPDGNISMPLVGDILAAELTPEQLQATITKRLGDKYINSPDVTVAVVQVNSKKFYIHGEVNSPGAYSLIVPTTVLEGLAEARGFKEFANLKKIRILRGKQQFLFNYKGVTHGKHPEQNIYLRPGDEIIVP